jgi:hypothetical protein
MCDNSIFQNSYVSGIIGSFLASFLFLGTLEAYKFYKLKIRQSKFKKIFGTYDNDKLNLVLPVFCVRPDVLNELKKTNIQLPEFPLITQSRKAIRSSKLFAKKDYSSLKYLLDIIAVTLGDKSVIVSDEDLSSQLDLSFISFGGSSFYFDFVLKDSDNTFYDIENNLFFVNKRDATKKFTGTADFDYGLILKYKHGNFPNRTWIVIAGLGETGTSGAGWYLSKNWAKLADTVKDKPFGIIIQVKHGVDESAKQVDILF